MSTEALFRNAKKASYALMNATTAEKDAALSALAGALAAGREAIHTANAKDMEAGRASGLSPALLDRLELTDKRMDAMIQGVRDIVAQPDPIGTIVDGYRLANGLNMRKVRVPLGVIGMIYESRPNVTVDAAALCIKSGNVCVLRGGKEAIHTNKTLGRIICESLSASGLPDYSVTIVETTDREVIKEMVTAVGLIDLVVPRGGEGLISFVTQHARVPLVKHDKGICHVYVDKYADASMAVEIALNAKVQRPGVCNAMETLLVHADAAKAVLPELAKRFSEAGVEIRADEAVRSIISAKPATDADWSTEYLDLIVSIRMVDGLSDAIDHINTYGSGHSEAIVTNDFQRARTFQTRVDAAAVYVNASTRFTDGAEFGLGAELGISTQKLHCRGPMGAFDMTTTKYLIDGDGQVRA